MDDHAYQEIRGRLAEEYGLQLPERPAPVYLFLGEFCAALLREREAERREVAGLRAEVAALRAAVTRYEAESDKVRLVAEAEHLRKTAEDLAAGRARVLCLLLGLGEALRAAGRAQRLPRRQRRDQTRRQQAVAQRRREAAARAELAAHRAALLGVLWSRVELPAIPELPARIAFLLRRPAQAGDDRFALRDLRRNAGSPTILRIEKAARGVAIPPRWLAFGECCPGDDVEGLGLRMEEARKAADLRRKTLARRAGISASMLHVLALGYRTTGTRAGIRKGGAGRPVTASLDTVAKLAGALGCSPGWLAFGGPCAAPGLPAAGPERIRGNGVSR